MLYLLGEGSRGLPKRADAWQVVNLGGRQDLDGELGFVIDDDRRRRGWQRRSVPYRGSPSQFRPVEEAAPLLPRQGRSA